MADLNTTLDTRHAIGSEATYQAEAMLRALLDAAHNARAADLPSLLKGMVPRLLALNGVSMSCHDADTDSVEDLRELLHGGYENPVQPEVIA